MYLLIFLFTKRLIKVQCVANTGLRPCLGLALQTCACI